MFLAAVFRLVKGNKCRYFSTHTLLCISIANKVNLFLALHYITLSVGTVGHRDNQHFTYHLATVIFYVKQLT